MKTRSHSLPRGCAALLAALSLSSVVLAQVAPTPNQTPTETPTPTPTSSVAHSDKSFMRKASKAGQKEIAISQAVMDRLSNANLRSFAQQMITDHTAANGTLMPIAQGQEIGMPTAVSPQHQAMMDRLSQMSGVAFDTAYINMMIQAHGETLAAMNNQLTNGQSQVINVWVQNTRPVVMQHEQIAEQIKAELPRAG